MGRRRGRRGGGRSSRSSKSRSRSSGRSTRGGTASKSSGGTSSRGGRGRGRSTGRAGRGAPRSKSQKAKSWSSSQTGALGAAIAASKAANPGAWSKALSGGVSQSAAASPKAHWSTTQTGDLGAAIKASQTANPLAWGKTIAGGTSITLKSFSTALDQGKEMSARPTKFTLKTTHITKEGGYDFKAASAAFFAATPFSFLPSAAAESDKKSTESDSTSLGISVGDGYLVTGGPDMQNKAAEGLSNIAGMLDSSANKETIQNWQNMQQKDAEGNTVISAGTWRHLQSMKGLDSTTPPAVGSGYVIGKTGYKTNKRC